MRHAAKKVLHQPPNLRNASRSPDKHNLVDLSRLKSSIFKSLRGWTYSAVDNRLNQPFKHLAGNFAPIMFAAKQFHIKLDARLRGERDLRLDHSLPNQLNRFTIAANVESQVATNVVKRDGDQKIVNVIAAKMRIAIGCNDFKD